MHRQSYKEKSRGGKQLHRLKEESWDIDNVSLFSFRQVLFSMAIVGLFDSFSALEATCGCSNPRAGNAL